MFYYATVVVEGLKHASHPVEASGTKTPVNISMRCTIHSFRLPTCTCIVRDQFWYKQCALFFFVSLPEHYYFLDTDSLQLALWDEDKLSWRSQGLQDVSFNLGMCIEPGIVWLLCVICFCCKRKEVSRSKR